MSMDSWFVLAAMLSPIGYVLQDVVADAMTVEAVPIVYDGSRGPRVADGICINGVWKIFKS